MAARGASRGSTVSLYLPPSAKRPVTFTRPPLKRKKAAEAQPAKRSGTRAGAASDSSPLISTPVMSGVGRICSSGRMWNFSFAKS